MLSYNFLYKLCVVSFYNNKNSHMKNLNKLFLIVFSLIMSVSIHSQNGLNISESTLSWEGKKITGSGHNGSLQFQDSNVIIENGKITSGVFSVDMTSLTCDDLTGKGKKSLEGHLRSEDFFAVDKYNTASLIVTKVANNIASGILTIKDISHPINFSLKKSDDGYTADLVFDRSKYDVKYASGSFFKNLGDKLILNEIELSAKLKFN